MTTEGILTKKKKADPNRKHELEITVQANRDNFFIQVPKRCAGLIATIKEGSHVEIETLHNTSEFKGRTFNNILLTNIKEI